MRTPHLLSLLALVTATPLVADDLFIDDAAVPEVLTATRLKQAPAAVPGSMTVLDRALIEATGARDIPELMRLVPGMMVGYLSGHETTVNYHGTNVTEARRMQVLIDGRSVYRPGLATVDWNDIPVAIEDIERIEVFRGPNSVSYGANALMGVINILTRNPADSIGTRLKYTQGQRGIRDWYASEGFELGSGALRVSLSGKEDDGFDHDHRGNDYRDSRRLTRFNLSATHTLDEQQSIDWQLAAKEGSNQEPYDYESIFLKLEPGDSDSDVVARDYAGSLRWNLDLNPQHSLYVQSNVQHWERKQEWRACDGAIAFSPQLAELFQLGEDYFYRVLKDPSTFSSGTPQQQALALQIRNQSNQPTCGNVNKHLRETRYDLELQDTYSLSESLRLVSGLSYRYDQASSETFFNGKLSNQLWRAFGHMEWTLGEHWVLQGGAMFEDDELTDSSLTPRLAVNYLITPQHGLRAVYSEAVRSADMYENNVDWRYRITDLSPAINGSSSGYFFTHARGPGDLKQEIMRSRELGYNGLFADLGLAVDVKLFYDEIHRMISAPLQADNFQPNNDDMTRFKGAETQLDWRLSSADRLRLTYAYVDFVATSRQDQRLTARNSGSAGWLHDWGQGWSSSVFYYGADMLNEYRFERLDLRVAKRIRLGSTDLQLAGVMQQRLDDEPLTWKENLYDERRLLYLSAELEF